MASGNITNLSFGFLLVRCCCITNFGKMAEKIVPVVKASEEEEEELVDPQKQLRTSASLRYSSRPKPERSLKDECSQKPDAQNLWNRYQECNDRVNSRSQTTETCEEELIDYIHVLDKCVNKDLFKRLK